MCVSVSVCVCVYTYRNGKDRSGSSLQLVDSLMV